MKVVSTEALTKLIQLVKSAFIKVEDVVETDTIDSSTIAGWGMPSTKTIDLVLGASGSTYTAPANGRFHIAWVGTNNDAYCSLDSVSTNNLSCDVHEGTQYATNTLEVKKGTTIIIYYKDLTVRRFTFIYAEGETE